MEILKQLIPPEYIRGLAWLGRHDWLRLALNNPDDPDDRTINLKFGFPSYDGKIPMDDYTRIKTYVGLCQKSRALMNENIWAWTLSKLFFSGPKLFKSTFAQCEAMMQVTIDIPFAEYTQPYPVVMFEYPIAFCKQMAEKLKCERFPSASVCHWSPEQRVIHTSSIFGLGDCVTAIMPFRQQLTVEQSLVRRANNDAMNKLVYNAKRELIGAYAGTHPDDEAFENEFSLGEVLQRMALNFCLLMSHYNVTDKPLNPENWKKHRRDKNSKDRAVSEKARGLIPRDIRLIEFDQSVTFYETQRELNPEAVTPTGRKVHPHWRKGHWRMQAHGPQLSLRKRMFIKPLMVRKEAFIGEIQDTTVTYVSKEMPR